MQQVRRTGGRGELQIPVDHVRRASFDRSRIEHGSRHFADLRAMKSYEPVGSGRRGQERRLHQTLKIDSQVETLFAKLPPGADDAAQSTVERNHLIDKRIPFEQRHPTRPDRPTDVAIGKTVLKARHCGQSVNYVAHRAETNHQNTHLCLRRSLLSGVYVLKERLVTLLIFRFETDRRGEAIGQLRDVIDCAQTGHQFGACGCRKNRIGRSRNQDQQFLSGSL